MNLYLAVKWLHILASVVLVGTGFGSAFYCWFVNRSRNVAAQAVVLPLVVRADWWFTLPTVVLQPASGLALLHLSGLPWTTPWVLASIGLYAVAGACWLPVVWLQIRMSALARAAHASDTALPDRFWRYERTWTLLGIPAFAAMLAVYWLMVTRPQW